MQSKKLISSLTEEKAVEIMQNHQKYVSGYVKRLRKGGPIR